jgi:4-amino-4-deoxy-L-arabinose transferase-like glycosyltransferase
VLVLDNIPGPARFAKAWLLPLAFLVGLVYLFLLPPWQQNDEPAQFEHVWQVANLGHWPRPGDVDAQMRRDVLASMIAHGFYHTRPEQQPVLAQLEDPVTIGVPQQDGMPLYYFLASLPLRVFRDADITQQLYMARLVSLLLFVTVVYFSIQITNLLFGNHLLGWMIAIFIALLPQLAYRMTAVNDDAAAVAAMTFFVWMSVRGIKLGLDLKTAIGIVVGVGLCVLSKPTAWLAIPFGVLVFLLSFFHARPRLVWAGVSVIAILVLLLVFEWQAALPANFYQNYHVTRRVRTTQAPDGNYSFMTTRSHNGFYQVIDKEMLNNKSAASGGIVTVGVWVWSNQPVEAPFAQLQFNGNDVLKVGKVNLTTQPSFLTIRAQIPLEYRTPVLRVVSNALPEGVEVYWDCFILVPGERSGQAPTRTSENCALVDWDGYSGENLIRNPSAEHGWLPLRENVASFVTRVYHYHQITDLWAFLDPPTSRLYLTHASEYLFRTFWGRFNWGTLGLTGQKPYRLFVVLSTLALIGSTFALWRYRRTINWNMISFLGLLLILHLVYTIFRFTGNWDNYYVHLPQARYFFPAIFPAAFFICFGWYTLLAFLLKLKQFKKTFVTIFVGLFLLYNGWAWYTIWSYWNRV